MQGELNRRLAVLAGARRPGRRADPFEPKVSLAEIEKRMGFPRDHLDFTTWYLSKKGYTPGPTTRLFADCRRRGLHRDPARRFRFSISSSTTGNVACNVEIDEEDVLGLDSANTPMIVLPDMTRISERRTNARERRTGAPDWRAEKAERRKGSRRAED